MKKIDIQEFNELIKTANYIKPKLKRDLKFNNSIASLTEEEWNCTEMLPIFDKSKNHGVLVVDFDDNDKYFVPFDLYAMSTNVIGRTKPIICDFCRTWRPGSESSSISFPKDKQSLNTVTFLCCGDLKCSMNSRNKTDASIKSRTQICEDISIDDKILRLKNKITEVINDLGLKAIEQAKLN